MSNTYKLSALVLGSFAALIIFEARNYEYMTGIGPGGGFFPLWLGIALLILSCLMFMSAMLTEKKALVAKISFPDREGLVRLGTILGAILLAAGLMESVGFRLTMLGFLLLMLRTLGRQKPVTMALVAALGSFGVAYVFSEWLRVPLPVGSLGI